jgi:hypothetical protein
VNGAMKTVKLSRAKNGIDCVLHLRLPVAVEYAAGQIAGVLGEKTESLLSTNKLPHVALVNLPDDERAAAKFVDRWGPLRATENYFISVSDVSELLDLPQNEAVRKLASTHSAAHKFFLQPSELVFEHREILRKAWKGNRMAIEAMQQRVSANTNSDWTFSGRRIEIRVPDLWSAICILFLRDRASHKISICRRRDECPAQYFIKPRTDQEFCGGDCKRWARLEVKKRWWHKHKGRKRKNGYLQTR